MSLIKPLRLTIACACLQFTVLPLHNSIVLSLTINQAVVLSVTTNQAVVLSLTTNELLYYHGNYSVIAWSLASLLTIMTVLLTNSHYPRSELTLLVTMVGRNKVVRVMLLHAMCPQVSSCNFVWLTCYIFCWTECLTCSDYLI